MLLVKITAIIVLVWFFQSAKSHGEQPFKWAMIGLIGYGIAWEIVHLVVDTLTDSRVVAATVPAIFAFGITWFIHKKLSMDAQKSSL
jgi:hypothetical protein